MAISKTFKMSTVLGLVTGKVIDFDQKTSTFGDGSKRLHDLVSFVKGKNVKASEEYCIKAIIDQHSFLASIDASSVHDEKTALSFLKEVENKHGKTIVISKIEQ